MILKIETSLEGFQLFSDVRDLKWHFGGLERPAPHVTPKSWPFYVHYRGGPVGDPQYVPSVHLLPNSTDWPVPGIFLNFTVGEKQKRIFFNTVAYVMDDQGSTIETLRP